MKNNMHYILLLLTMSIILAGIVSANNFASSAYGLNITLYSPLNGSIVNTTTPQINFSISTNQTGISNISIALDSVSKNIFSVIGYCSGSTSVTCIFNSENITNASNLTAGIHNLSITTSADYGIHYLTLSTTFTVNNTSTNSSTPVANTTITGVYFAFNNNLADGTDPYLAGSAEFNGTIKQTGHPLVARFNYTIAVYYNGSNITNSTLTDNYGDAIALYSYDSQNDQAIYAWNTSNVSGVRNFTLGGNSLTVAGQLVQVTVWSDADEFLDGFNNVTLRINQYNSSVSGNVNFNNDAIKYQNLNTLLTTYNINASGLDVTDGYMNLQSEILDPLTINVAFNKGQTYPNYTTIFVNSTSNLAWILNGFFTYEKINDSINGSVGSWCDVTMVNLGDYSCFNNAIVKADLNKTYGSTAQVYKSGTYYYAYLDEGYETYNNNTILNISSLINSNLHMLNPANFFDSVASYINSTGIFSISNINTTAVTMTNAAGNVTFDLPNGTLSVNGSDISDLSGTYTLNVTATDSYGNKASKTMTVVLNINSKESSENIYVNTSNANGTTNITFANPGISNIIRAIVLPNNSTNASNFTLNVNIYGATLPPNTSAPGSSLANNPLIYIVFNSTTPLVNNSFTIYFDVPKAMITGVYGGDSNIHLFVFDELTSSWIMLNTTLLNGTTDPEQFMAITPHFSTFVVASSCPSGTQPLGNTCVVPVAPTHSSGGGGGGGYVPPQNISYNMTNATISLSNTTGNVSFENTTPEQLPVVSHIEPVTLVQRNESNGSTQSKTGITGNVVNTPAGTPAPLWMILGIVVIGVLVFTAYKVYYKRK